ncbi:hypothetical protein DPMN_192592 [Dreissena polymorpha]|uniref:Uncharacterized protein n=1 Tax=Dreissena polymorpha TaxID=45954 RepID=A0A9D3Y7E4_DREPO|nr:hypothetical protein DPMN_192592 [Dreissena polymorpha]
MMDAGPRVILRLRKIRKAIIASPEPMLWFSKTMMELEMVHQAWMNLRAECTAYKAVVDTSDFILEALDRRRLEILIELRQRIFLDGNYVNDLYSLCTRILM